MALDQQWLDKLRNDDGFLDRNELVVAGVPIELPTGEKRPKNAHRQWQRRVIDDILPDSPNADASEKIPFRILKSLTTARHTTHSLEEVLSGEFGSLDPVFWRGTKGSTRIPVAFHVLAVRGASKTVDSRAFTERTFLLLMRREDGHIEQELLTRFLERFRLPSERLDLAQAYVLEHVEPNWNRETEFTVEVQDFLDPVSPFVQDAAVHFRRDVETLLAADLPAADHFHYVNILLALHLGLYMPRLAYRLNSSLDLLEECLKQPDSVKIDELKEIESGQHPESRFTSRLKIRAPSLVGQRRLPLNSQARVSYEAMKSEMQRLHFSLLLFHRVRELTKSYIRATQNISEPESLFEMTRFPSQIAQRLKWYPEFRAFMQRALDALALRFVHEQLSGRHKAKGEKALDESDNGFAALRQCYQIYNFQPTSTATKTRAHRQGLQVVERLLKHSEYGIIQSRRGVGSYFELGVGLVPLLLLLVVGSEQEKVQVDEFWAGLARYGLYFEPEDRHILLSRLKSMGLYERFSDAGEANYIRNLLVGS